MAGWVLILWFRFVLTPAYIFEVVETTAVRTLVVVGWTRILSFLRRLPFSVAFLPTVGAQVAVLVMIRWFRWDGGPVFAVRTSDGITGCLILQKFVCGTLASFFSFNEMNNFIERHVLVCMS